MCGIFGVTIKDSKKHQNKDIEKLTETLFRLSETRGKEASGLAVRKPDSFGVIKSPLCVSDFLKSTEYKNFAQDNLAVEGGIENNFWSAIGHSRLATHGDEYQNKNNQPLAKEGVVCVHNGIVANDKDLWDKFPELKRSTDLDTEVLISLLRVFFKENGSLPLAVKKTFDELEGSASLAFLFDDKEQLLLATNTGSLYFVLDEEQDIFVFGSERYILEEFIKKTKKIESFNKEDIKQLKAGSALLLDLTDLSRKEFSFEDVQAESQSQRLGGAQKLEIKDHTKNDPDTEVGLLSKKKNILTEETKREMTMVWQDLYENNNLKRCTKCLMPETMTFIDFDERGVCNYCRGYKKIEVAGADALMAVAQKHKRTDDSYDCLVPFSGGRDSAYGLHYIKKVLKMNPVAFTYDWGVMTDIGRRNQARVCGKLGVEHIIISADIRKKRKNVGKNLKAWLKKPELGMVPILMAGDKDMLSYIAQVGKKTNTDLIVDCYGKGLEDDLIKVGLAGIKLEPGEHYNETISFWEKTKPARYYLKQYLLNPSYFNASIFDNVAAYYWAFFFNYKHLHLFNYLNWNEKELLDTIINEYGWEREKETIVTWRIDDGTAALYNYIYMVALGFSENDTFRSVQVREGNMSREEAMNLIKEENRPRFESLEWYAGIIDFDINEAIRIINSIPKRYKN